MKLKDVKIGMEAVTKVCGKRVRVHVVAKAPPDVYSKRDDRFWVERFDNGRHLPKPRRAAALTLAPLFFVVALTKGNTVDVWGPFRSKADAKFEVGSVVAADPYIRKGYVIAPNKEAAHDKAYRVWVQEPAKCG